MSLELLIARHGQNEDNLNGILNGHRDFPLTDLGREQAAELGSAIKDSGMKFTAVYSSPLSRALNTAQIVALIADMPDPKVYDELIERDFGVMTGKRADQIEDLCAPSIIKTDTVTYFLSPDGAETFPQLVERGQKIIDHMRSVHDDGRVLLVCHGDIGKMIYCAATGKDWQEVLTDFHFGNGDLIDISDDSAPHKVKLAQFNN